MMEQAGYFFRHLERSREIPKRYLKANIPGFLDSAALGSE